MTTAKTSPKRPASPLTTVAMVTLGCARNEVDSEELAGRLEAGGFRLVEDPEDAETVVVNTCGFVEAAKKDSVDTLLAAADLKDGRQRAQAVVAVGCLAERYGAELADVAARGRRGARLRRLPRHRRQAALDPRRRDAAPAHARRTAAGCCRSPRPSGPTPPAYQPGHGAERRAARRRADGAAEAGLRLRPALHLLRDPGLPRLVRLAAALRRARRGPLAGRAGRARAVPGQRELHVLRQGPRRPAPAGDAAARARRGRRRRAGAGVLPPARRDAARAW